MERWIKPVIVLSVLGLWVRAMASWATPGTGTSAGGAFRWLAGAYGLVILVSLIWRLSLWIRYRPRPSVADAELPSLSLVIPAFNEGMLVRESILAAGASRYPSEKFEIIAIDDGSTDDTWRYIQSAAQELSGCVRIETIRLPVNRGKRQALFAGFRRARGEAWATTDSDSLLEPDTLRNAVSPMVLDSRVDCVAGCIRALNASRNVITRFMKCYFSLSFKFVRAHQDVIGGVFCSPGAMSVYRASAVRPVLQEWLNQRFLGLPCATGEDRAMTNLLLREGGRTAYQQNAVAWSRVPESYRGMARMFLRWSRSNIRETMVLWGFLCTRFRAGSITAFRVNMSLLLLSMILSPVLIGHSAGLLFMSDGFLLRYLAAMMSFSTVMAGVYYANERDGDWVWQLVYPIYSTFCLSWIMPYAAMTLRNTAWLTRSAGPSGPALMPEAAAA